METWLATMIVGLVTALFSFLGVWLTNRKSQALSDYKIEELTKEVHEHNKVITRTFELEKRADLVDAEVKRINHRLTDLEKG